jgi:hypothetical protein
VNRAGFGPPLRPITVRGSHSPGASAATAGGPCIHSGNVRRAKELSGPVAHISLASQKCQAVSLAVTSRRSLGRNGHAGILPLARQNACSPAVTSGSAPIRRIAHPCI